MRHAREDLFGYHLIAGHPRLRRALAEYLAVSRGVRCTPEQVIVLTGAQAALDLIGRMFMDPGDHFWIEDPGYLGAYNAFRAAGGKAVPLPVGPEGWRLDEAARGGLKAWSVDDIAEYLLSGRNGHSHADGPMAQVVLNSTSHMSEADVRAMAVYLKDLTAGPSEPAVAAASPEQMTNGEKLYKGSCVACHELDGSGAPRIYPPLPGNANLQSANAASLAFISRKSRQASFLAAGLRSR